MCRRSWKRIRGSPAFVQEVRERPAKVACVHRPPELVGEDESDRVVPLSVGEAFGCVPSGVPPKRAHGGPRKLQLASRTGGLRLADGWGAAPWPVQRAGDPKPAGRQVDIAPAQREQLALAHTRGHGEDVQRLQAIVSDRVQQRPDLARVEGPHLVVGPPRWLHQRSRVAGDEPQRAA